MPRLASSKRPTRCEIAPVNAPRSCPNSSLSSSPVGIAAQLSFTKPFAWRALRLCTRARDQFLAGAGFAVDQHRGIGGRDGLHLLQHAAQRLALADDLFELQLAADFVFEVQLLLRELVLQVGNFAERQRVFDGDRHLARDLA